MAIPISIQNQQLGVRLLELPPDLVELLESPNPPVVESLQLKSVESSSTTQSPANAVLCTSTRSLEIRQVQSSNVLYILQQSADSGFTSFAQCKGMLELVPSKADVEEYIRGLLPVYVSNVSNTKLIKQASFVDDAPFSSQELRDAIRRLCVFEIEGNLWLPDSKDLITAWRSLLTEATIKSIKLDEPWNPEELASLTVEDEFDRNVYNAVVSRLNHIPSDSPAVVFEASDATAWIGQMLLSSMRSPISSHDFMLQWQDLLPEIWRPLANLDLLKNKHRLSEDGFLSTMPDPRNEPNLSNTTLPPKSKWHQKFRK